jgi:hypothetical protein
MLRWIEGGKPEKTKQLPISDAAGNWGRHRFRVSRDHHSSRLRIAKKAPRPPFPQPCDLFRASAASPFSKSQFCSRVRFSASLKPSDFINLGIMQAECRDQVFYRDRRAVLKRRRIARYPGRRRGSGFQYKLAPCGNLGLEK